MKLILLRANKKAVTTLQVALGIAVIILFAVGGYWWYSLRPTEYSFEAIDPAPYLSDERDDAWRNDLKYLDDTLRAFHSDLFYDVSEQDYSRAVSNLHNSIPSLTDKR